jgi:hypothetical protein
MALQAALVRGFSSPDINWHLHVIILSKPSADLRGVRSAAFRRRQRSPVRFSNVSAIDSTFPLRYVVSQ